MKYIALALFILAAFCSSRTRAADTTCMDAVLEMMRGAEDVNEGWLKACNEIAGLNGSGRDLCKIQHDNYKKVFDKHLRGAK